MRIRVTIAGITPLICNRFTEEAATGASNKARKALVVEQRTPLQIAESKLYRSIDGETLIVPGVNIFRAIIDAGRFFKHGKSTLTTAKASLIPACVAIEDVEIPIVCKEPWTLDQRPIRNPSTGARVLAYRPIFHDWSLTFVAEIDTSMIGESTFRAILDAAGSKVGLCDFRPSCKGPYGRFVVNNWEVLGG